MNYQELRTAMEATGKLIPQGSGEAVRCDIELLAPAAPWAHLRWMVAESLTWGPGRAEKLNRWLGFVQGTLWGLQVVSVEQMRQVNLGARAAPPWADACTCGGIGGWDPQCQVHI